MKERTAKTLKEMAELVKEIEQMTAKATRGAAVFGQEGDLTSKLKLLSATDQAEALREQIRKYRAWLKIRGLIEDLREPLDALVRHEEVEGTKMLVQVATDLQKFGEEEICPFSDFDVLNKLANERKKDAGKT